MTGTPARLDARSLRDLVRSLAAIGPQHDRYDEQCGQGEDGRGAEGHLDAGHELTGNRL